MIHCRIIRDISYSKIPGIVYGMKAGLVLPVMFIHDRYQTKYAAVPWYFGASWNIMDRNHFWVSLETDGEIVD